jgi:hypothetical protein
VEVVALVFLEWRKFGFRRERKGEDFQKNKKECREARRWLRAQPLDFLIHSAQCREKEHLLDLVYHLIIRRNMLSYGCTS